MPPPRLAFPPALEALYRSDGKAERLAYQRRVCLAAATLFLTFLFADASVVPDVLPLGLLLRGTCFLATLPLIAMLTPRTPDWLADALLAWFVLPFSLTVAALFAFSHAPDRAAYLTGIVVNVTLSNTCLQQRFRWAVASNAAVMGIVLVCLPLSGIAPAVQNLQIGLLFSTMALTLAIAHRLEWQSRRAYLLSLREQLRRRQLQRSNTQLATLSERDSLTGLANRRAVDRHLQKAWSACAVAGLPLVLIMIDVDCFKRYNDTYGHPAGDACLRAIGELIRLQMRQDDLAGRYGGEEFIAILQGVEAVSAQLIAERIREAVQELAIPHITSTVAGMVTVSVGLACARPEPGMIAADLLQAADAALYQAKQTGRSRVCFAETVA